MGKIASIYVNGRTTVGCIPSGQAAIKLACLSPSRPASPSQTSPGFPGCGCSLVEVGFIQRAESILQCLASTFSDSVNPKFPFRSVQDTGMVFDFVIIMCISVVHPGFCSNIPGASYVQTPILPVEASAISHELVCSFLHQICTVHFILCPSPPLNSYC